MVKHEITIENDFPIVLPTGYDEEQKAKIYMIIQSCIVDKTPFYKHMVKLLEGANTKGWNNSVFVPGIGPGKDVVFLHENFFSPKKKNLHVLGIDYSTPMVKAAKENILHSKGKSNIIGGLKSRLNLLLKENILNAYIPMSNFERQQIQPCGPSEVIPYPMEKPSYIIASQVEHYFPNNDESPLFKKYEERNSKVLTKKGFMECCKDIAADQGIYFSIDDFIDKNPLIQKQNERIWDTYIAKNLGRAEIISGIKKIDKKLAEKIEENYGIHLNENLRTTNAQRNRVRRREHDYEEIRTLNEHIDDIIEVFGENAQIDIIQHPKLPNFYMTSVFYQKK